MQDLWSGLEHGSVFQRGLPLVPNLRKPEVSQVFRTVLRNSHVTMEMLDHKGQDALKTCFKSGWLHATRLERVPASEAEYIFTSPLHRWFVEFYLGNLPLDPNTIEDRTLFDFVIKVLRHFSRGQLSSPRVVGTSEIQRPLEAQFHDEFYRCCAEYSQGSLISFPEFGPNGRIEFCIPCKKWGVELLRDGDKLEGYASCFVESGAYTKMNLTDHIILDFRKSRPRKPHPG